MKSLLAKLTGSRNDAEVAEWITNLIGLMVIVFVIALFLLAMGLDNNP